MIPIFSGSEQSNKSTSSVEVPDPSAQGHLVGWRLVWKLFGSHRRGYWSLWIFCFIFLLSLCSEFVVNDRPLLIIKDGQIYTPIFVSYTETDLGGLFPTEANYLDDAFMEELEQQGSLVIWPPFPHRYDSHSYNLSSPAPTAPDIIHWLGTDDQARDVLARVLYGLRISILFGFILTVASSIIGVFVGLIQGFFGGLLDLIAQRVLEVWSSLPSLYILIILSSLIRPNFWWLLSILLLFSWATLVAVVRAEALKVRSQNYVRAARALGVSESKIILRHVLPNAMTATLTFLPFLFAGSIGSLASLDFLGFGLPPGSPSLGELLLQGKNNLQAPWLAITGFITLALTLTLLVFIGEGVRHAFDPYRRYLLHAHRRQD